MNLLILNFNKILKYHIQHNCIDKIDIIKYINVVVSMKGGDGLNKLSKLNEQLAQLYKELTGKGPKSLKTYFNEDLVIIKFELYDIKPLNRLEIIEEGRNILPLIYKTLYKNIKPQIESIIEKSLEIKVNSVFFDAEKNAFNKEKIIVVLLDEIIQ